MTGFKMSKASVIIAEDHTIVRQGLRMLLNKCENLEVVGEAGDGLEAIRCIRNMKPDLLILDIRMPKLDGISVINEAKKINPNLKIIVLTIHRDDEYITQAFKAGADGYCLKSSPFDEVEMSVKAVLAGKRYISSEISAKVLGAYLVGEKQGIGKSGWQRLTQREKEVLKLVGEGYKNKEIANFLYISVKTIEKHRANIMEKLDIHTASGLAGYASEKGLVNR